MNGFRGISQETRQICQKLGDFRGIVLEICAELAGFRRILPEARRICQKLDDFRGIVLKNDKSAEIRRI